MKVKEAGRKRTHYCNPNRCHKCPDLDGEIMPGCMGTAASANGPHDLSRCTCNRTIPQMDDEVAKLRREVAYLRETLQILVAQRSSPSRKK